MDTLESDLGRPGAWKTSTRDPAMPLTFDYLSYLNYYCCEYIALNFAQYLKTG